MYFPSNLRMQPTFLLSYDSSWDVEFGGACQSSAILVQNKENGVTRGYL